MKYVPVLRYRSEEREALKSLTLSDKIAPLIEVIQEPKGISFKEYYQKEFAALNSPLLIDFPLYFNVTDSTDHKIRHFLLRLKEFPDDRLGLFEQLAENKHIVPVISYNMKEEYDNGCYKSYAKRLRNNFSQLAFRVFPTNDFESVLRDIKSVIQSQDILLMDLDELPHKDLALLKKYIQIRELKNQKKCTTVLIRSAISSKIHYNKLIDGAIVSEVDNSLLTAYVGYGFDAFGDFAGIRKDKNITGGKAIKVKSAGFLYYSWHGNCYYGYRGLIPQLDEFLNHIRPTLMKAKSWDQFSEQHHENCPGCSAIREGKHKSYGYWKRYAIQHYLYTMNEYI